MKIAGSASLYDLPWGVVPQNGWKLARSGQKGRQIDAGLEAHPVEHMNEVFRADITRRARREGAPADSAEGSVEAVRARMKCCQNVRQARATGIMKMKREFEAGEFQRHATDEIEHLPWIGHAGGVGKGHAREA